MLGCIIDAPKLAVAVYEETVGKVWGQHRSDASSMLTNLLLPDSASRSVRVV